MEKKITKLMVVEMMLANEEIAKNEIFKNYLENEKSLLQKKSENRKATKNQIENEEIKKVIVQVMSVSEPHTATEVLNLVKATDVEKYGTLTNQRISALLKQLVENGQVIKSIEKKVSKFVLV